MNSTQSKRMYRINRSSAAAILNKTSIGLKLGPQSRSPSRSRNDSFSIKPLDNNFEVTNRITTYKPTKSTKKLQNFLLSHAQSPSSVSQASTKLPMKSTLASTNQVFWSPKAIKSPNLLRQTRINSKNNCNTNISAYDICSPPLDFNSREESLNNSIEATEEHDFTSDRFLTRLMEKLSATPGTNPTTTLYFGRIAKQISVKQAQLVVQSLVDTLKFIKQVKLGDGQKGLRRHYGISDDMDDPEKKVKEFTAAVNEAINICKNAINERYSRKRVEDYSKRMVDIALKTGNPGLVLYFVYVQGKLCIARCSFRAAINTFKYFKELCLKFDVFPRSMEAYKMLGRCYQALNLHKTSLIYFTKFLYMAWMRDSPRHELLAYDNIGLQFYYLGNLEKAEYFHTRMVGGKHEPKDSRLRKIGILKMKMNKAAKNSEQIGGENYLYDADNDFDIDVEMDRVTKKLDKDDEGDEVSYRDEGFEPPLFNVEDEDENRKTLETLKQSHFDSFNRRKTPMRAPVKLTAIPGFVKAKVALGKKQEEKIRKKGGTVSLKSSPESSFIASESLTNIVKPISTAIFSSRPNQQIFTSHLSRNRGLKNFSLAGAFNSSYNDNNDGMDELDSKSCDQIKRILDKVKINLEVIRESLVKARNGKP